jgi:hypothetical protein
VPRKLRRYSLGDLRNVSPEFLGILTTSAGANAERAAVQMPRGHSKDPVGLAMEVATWIDWEGASDPQAAALSGSNQKASGLAGGFVT